jgi:hypothetical protein
LQHPPMKAQINPGLSLSLDDKRGSRQFRFSCFLGLVEAKRNETKAGCVWRETSSRGAKRRGDPDAVGRPWTAWGGPTGSKKVAQERS